ncbi:hypothetical protein RJ639_001854 [Escallonia herrerae]|uniref:PRLI-interacting factor A n=1 Tax=Escallonia herrerae TaxID=1293975 RepID=A0AA88XD03_9ASTE|nr:hypothetical protein RJ639_001854 [Escallonia herrerae]
MNDQAQQMMNKSQIMNRDPMIRKMNQPPPQQMLSQPPPMMSQPPMMMSQSQPMWSNNSNRVGGAGGGCSYGMWPPHVDNHLKFQQNPSKFAGFGSSKQRPNWKGKKRSKIVGPGGSGGGGGGGYKPPGLKELQQQNRLKAKKYFPRNKFNNRSAPYAPRNTSSYIIRAKKSGGIGSLVSPCPVTPAVLPTPIFSPSREVLVDMAKEEWGVDGYGSMKGLIRLRSPGHEDDDEEEEGGSSGSDVEEHLEVEKRLNHDLNRFEMIYPSYGGSGGGGEYNNVLENRVDDQDTHIAQVEEENLMLKERLFLMERELGDLRRRLVRLERRSGVAEEMNEEVLENESGNESESLGYSRSFEDNNEGVVEEINEGQDVENKEESHDKGFEVQEGNKVQTMDVLMEEPEPAHVQDEESREIQPTDEAADNKCSEKSIGVGDASNCPALIYRMAIKTCKPPTLSNFRILNGGIYMILGVALH